MVIDDDGPMLPDGVGPEAIAPEIELNGFIVGGTFRHGLFRPHMCRHGVFERIDYTDEAERAVRQPDELVEGEGDDLLLRGGRALEESQQCLSPLLALLPKALRLHALGDVTDVAVDDAGVVQRKRIADKLHVDVAAIAGFKLQTIVVNVVPCLELSESCPGTDDVLERTKIPDDLPQKVRVRVAQQSHQERIDINHLSGVGIENQDAILGRFKEPPVTLLGIAERLLRLLAVGDVLEVCEEDQRLSLSISPQARVLVDPDQAAVLGEVALVHGPGIALSGEQAPHALAALSEVVGVRDLGEREARELLGRVTEQVAEGRVHALQLLVGRGHALADRGFVEEGPEARLVFKERALCRALIGLVAEDQHHPNDLALSVSDGHAAVGDGPPGAVLGDEQSVVGKAHDLAFVQDEFDRALDRGVGLLVDDLEDRGERLAQRPGLVPARERLGPLVHAGDSPGRIRDDHPDAVQRVAEALFTSRQGVDAAPELSVLALSLFWG